MDIEVFLPERMNNHYNFERKCNLLLVKFIEVINKIHNLNTVELSIKKQLVFDEDPWKSP